LFKIEKKLNIYELEVNINPKLLSLIKELQNFKKLGVKVPMNIKLKSQEVQAWYPVAIRLQDSIRSFNYTN
jgi:hypothetical protein